MIDRADLDDALFAGAGAGEGHTASHGQVTAFRHRVLRFLAELPDDLSVCELREVFDEEEDDDADT